MMQTKRRIIPASQTPRQPPTWQRVLADAIDHPEALYAELGLDPATLPTSLAAHRDFTLRVPRGYVARMRHGDPDDPLLRQVLPLGAELDIVPGFGIDPVGDHDARRSAGLLHKYQGRALLITTGACAIHCRYCFRRHFPYGEYARGVLTEAVETIAADPSIHEVILSGGDPLSLSDARLAELAQRLHAIPHVRRLRIHTRQPIVLPERVTPELLDWLSASPLQKVIVVHANHANEIDADVSAVLTALRDSGATLLNQAVLLRGVNDNADALVALSERLMQANVLPYYLHQLDRVAGAAHFEVDDERARRLHREIAKRLPGYLLPRLVREIPGEAGKTALI